MNVNQIIAWENGEIDPEGELDLFSELIKSGDIVHLQGCYGRHAMLLVDAGYLNMQGDIL